MISYCRFITIFLFVFSFNSYAVDSNVCANGGDEFATFKYAGFLTDENQNTVSGFQTVELQVSLFDSFESGQELYTQFLPSVEVADGVFQIEVGPCIPSLSGDTFLQLHVNNQALSPRSKVVASALSLQSYNSKRFAGLTTSEFFFEVDSSVQQHLTNYSQNTIDPDISNITQQVSGHIAQINNPHSVTKDQVGLSAVDNTKQLPFTHLQLVLVPTSDTNVPSSKAVADYLASQLNPFTVVNQNLESRVSAIEVSNAANASISYLQSSQLQTVLATNSDVNIPTSSAVATFVKDQVYYTDAIPADQFNSVQVAYLMSGVLADGSAPWTNIPADQFTSTEVSNLQAGGLANGTTPWTANVLPVGTSSEYLRGDKSLAEIPADQFSGGEVSNLQAGLLANGATPWQTSEPSLGIASNGQVLAGDRTWKQLNASLVNLGQVQNIDVLGSFTQNANAVIETSKVRANNSNGIAILNQANQGVFVNNAGNVGINTDTPTVDFQVAGDAKIVELFTHKLTSKNLSLLNTSVSPLRVSTNPNEDASLYVQYSGKVGINTTSPVYTLDVDGDVNMSGDLYIDGALFEQVVNAGGNLGTVVVGGQANSVIATNGIVIGGVANDVYGENSVISGGQSNFVPGHYSSISGGVLNTAAGIASGILAGSDNETYGLASAVVGGEFNISVGDDAVVAGGADNTAIGDFSFIGGGVANTVNASNSAIIGGNWMTIDGANVFGFNGSEYSVAVTSELTNAAVFFVDHFAIGNANPTEALDVTGRLRLRPSTDEFAYDGTLRWSGSDLELMKSGSWGPIGGGYAGIIENENGVQVEIEGATRFIVDSLGYVGVNTTAPEASFHVVGNSLFDGEIEATQLLIENDVYADIELASGMGSALRMNINTDGTASSSIDFARYSTNQASIRFNYSGVGVEPQLQFEVDNAPKLAIRTDVIELMNGVGIRFSDGSMQFTGVHPDVIENASSSTKIFAHDDGIDFNVSSSTQVRITTTGNLGVGEYNPMERLVVDGRIQLKSNSDGFATDGLIRYSGQDMEAFINGKWMSLTGQEQTNNVTNDILTTLNPVPRGLYDAGAVLVQDDIFVFGGSSDNENNLDGVYKYSINSQTWTTMTSMPAPKFSMAYALANDYIYVIGGEGPSGATSTIFKYDINGDSWTTLSAGLNYPVKVTGANGFEFGNKIYVVGGNDGSGTIGDMYSMDLSNPVTWIAEAAMVPRMLASLSVLGSNVYVFGGEDSSGTNDMQIYDGTSWETVASGLNFQYETARSVVIGDEIFIIGGSSGQGSNDEIVRFIPETRQFSVLSLLLEYPISSTFAVSDGQQAFYGGGYGESETDKFYKLEIRPFSDASGYNAFVGKGEGNSAESKNTGILAGSANSVSGDNSIIAGGADNDVDGQYSMIGAGEFNEITGYHSFIGGGDSNLVTNDYASVVSGKNNTASGLHSVVLGGHDNEVTGSSSTIVGGFNNKLVGDNSVILGGSGLTVNDNDVVGFNGTGGAKTIDSGGAPAAFFGVDKFSIGEVNPDDTLEVLDTDGDAILHLKGNGYSTLKLDAVDNASNSQILFLKSDVMKGMFDFNHDAIPSDEELKLYIGGATQFTFTGEGKLGIGAGNTNPAFTLDVAGDIKALNTLAITTDAGDTLLELVSGSTSSKNILDFSYNGAGSSMGKFMFVHNPDPALAEMKMHIDGVDALKIRTDHILLPSGSGLEFADGSIMRSNKSVAFSVYPSGTQTIDNSGDILSNFGVKSFDIGNDFDLIDDKFIVPVSGVYNLTSSVKITSPSVSLLFQIMIKKNGSIVLEKRCAFSLTSDQQCDVNGLVELNASDELKVHYHHNNGATDQTIDNFAKSTHFDGYLIHNTEQ
ncbi:MAG: hypothetical protein KC646_08195 [Candidatus Cloacimonetes bacterium]|nr:hypothetical protein [Candidatus Cloacimonadota bacterium]